MQVQSSRSTTHSKTNERHTTEIPKGGLAEHQKSSEAALTGRDETEGVGDLKSTRVEWEQQAYALEQGAVIPQGIGARARVLSNGEITPYRGAP